MSLNDALIMITDHVAAANSSFNREEAVDSARRQLVQALYEGVVRAEGMEWAHTDEDRDPQEEPPILPRNFVSIDVRWWSKRDRFEFEDGSLSLDKISVHFEENIATYEDYWSIYAFENIRVWREDISTNFRASLREPISVLQQEDNAIYRTGMPGRPTSKQLIMEELERRGAEGKLTSKLIQQARELLEWLIRVHPDAPRPTEKTIENMIRTRHRRLIGEQKNAD